MEDVGINNKVPIWDLDIFLRDRWKKVKTEKLVKDNVKFFFWLKVDFGFQMAK